MKKYAKYKDSQIGLLGYIPSHWQVMKLNYASEVITDFVASGSFADIKANVVYLNEPNYAMLVRTADLSQKDKSLSKVYISKHSYNYLSNSNLFGGEIILPNIGSVGEVYIMPNDLYEKMSLAPNAIMVKTKTCNKYFYYYFMSSIGKESLITLGQATTQNKFNKTQLRALKVFVPPLSEQEAIANFLDAKCGEIDRVIEKQRKRIELLEELKQSIITNAVTKGLNPNVTMRPSGIDWIGEIPEHWDVRRIKTLSSVKRGASPRPIDDPKYFDDNGEFSWVRIADVTASKEYLEETTQKLSPLGSSLSVKRFPGDIFISIAGTVGKPIITKIKCCIHDGFVYFPNLKYNTKLLYHIFKSGRPYLGLGKMGTQLNLNTETIGNIVIPIPPSTEQQEISDFIDQETAKIDVQIQRINREIELLEEYKQSIITEVVTGKRCVCDFAESPIVYEPSEPQYNIAAKP